MPKENYPTEAMREEARRGLEWRREYGRGGTAVGVARARDIANRVNLSDQTIRRMHSYFSRHEVDKQGEGFSPGEDGYPSAGRIAWALWGGDPGQRWAAAWVRRNESDNNRNCMITIENKAAKLRLDETVDQSSIKPLVQEIERVFGADAAAKGLVTGEITNCIANAADTLEIEINSPGGSVLDGYVLFNAINDMRERGVYVTAQIQLAASMASVIAMAADKIVMRKGARMMIHEASAVTMGDAAEHANKAELLEGISDEIAAIYSDRTGTPKDEIRAAMKKETWMDGPQAVAAGFADETFDNANKDKKAMNILDRLTKPANDEAIERIAALENQISDHDKTVAEFQAKIEVAEAALQEATTQLTAIKAQLDEANEKLEEAEKKAEEQGEKIEELEKASEDVEAKAAQKASEILAQTGHPAPVKVEDESNTRSHLETFNSLTGHEATAYYRKHKRQINAELSAKK